jgi:hypothetical protein
MNRVSVTELRAVYADYVAAVASLGIDVSDYGMIEGSATQGQSYRVRNKGIRAAGVGEYEIIGDTRAEATQTLRDITRGIVAARTALLGSE